MNPEPKTYLIHCIALWHIIFIAKSLIIWAKFPRMQNDGVENNCGLLGLENFFLTNMNNSLRIWKVQIETPTSSELVHPFGSPDSYLVTVESTANTIGICEG